MGRNYSELRVAAPRSEQKKQSKTRNNMKTLDRDTSKSFRIEEEEKENSLKLKPESVFPQIEKFRKCEKQLE